MTLTHRLMDGLRLVAVFGAAALVVWSMPENKAVQVTGKGPAGAPAVASPDQEQPTPGILEAEIRRDPPSRGYQRHSTTRSPALAGTTHY